MKKLNLLFFIVGMLCLNLALCAAATYYVDPVNGDDGNPGTEAQAWQSLEKVSSATNEFDTIYLKDFAEDWGSSIYDWPENRIWYSKIIMQFEFTWVFDKYYRIGRFVNNDFWVADTNAVNLNQIDPPAYLDTTVDPSRVRNGLMINPVHPRRQGFDSYASNYDPETNFGMNISPGSHLAVQPGSSIISSKSHETSNYGSYVQSAAVLTVLASVPPEKSFRPSYYGTDKTVKHNFNNLDSGKLGSLSRGGISSVPKLKQENRIESRTASVERMFERPWIDLISGWTGRTVHPSSNMNEYGRDISNAMGVGALMLHLDFPVEDKKRLLIRFTQLGLDLYGIVAGGSISHWSNDGGHCAGRKWPILFAGIVLNDGEIKSISKKSGNYLYSPKPGGGNYGSGDIPPDYICFQEDMQTFYVSEKDILTTPYVLRNRGSLYQAGTVNVVQGSDIVEGNNTYWASLDKVNYNFFGIIDDDQAFDKYGKAYPLAEIISNTRIRLAEKYKGITSANKTYKIADILSYGHGKLDKIGEQKTNPAADYGRKCDYFEFTKENLGLPEWGIVHATDKYQDGLTWGAPYRTLNGYSWPGWILAVHIMNAKELWNHDALFDYQDRHMDLTKPDGLYPGTRSMNRFAESMWDTYRSSLAPIWSGEEPKIQPDTGNIAFAVEHAELRVLNNIIKSKGNESATIQCYLAEAGRLSVKIYDSKGREIIVLCDEDRNEGVQPPIFWSGLDSNVKKVGSGVYMVHMKAGSHTETKKIVVVK